MVAFAQCRFMVLEFLAIGQLGSDEEELGDYGLSDQTFAAVWV